jgi:putative Holliday junction resolvase
MKHEVYIAFDYGLKKTGVAIAQSITKMASPLLSLKMNNGEPNWEDIDLIFESFKPNCAIFGMPTKQNNDSKNLTNRINSFSSKIEKRYQISIGFINEHLTSKIAKDKLKEQRQEGILLRQIKKGQIDSMAATIILQEWMNREEE